MTGGLQVLIIGKTKDYTLGQIEDLSETGDKIFCEDYNLYKVFRNRGVWTDMVFRHPGGTTFYNNFGEECKERELVIPANVTISKGDRLWDKYKIFQMKGDYYG